ncbi:MAG: quinone oxidoreductase [Candidatus Lambdaproteobacteria bacterium]|nr:quinone oxidoreductase [Candidatus Lambdaproteobacteria bacterium]
MKAIRIHEPGDVDKMLYEDAPEPQAGPQQMLIRHEAIGVNYSVRYNRSGQYKNEYPFIPGQEAAGIVIAVGAEVSGFAVGDRVAYSGSGSGAYAESAAVGPARVVKLPAGIDTRTAAAVLNQGLTAYYLSHQTFPLAPGQVCLIHAGAGGVGQLLIQMARRRGATVIATVSSDEKARAVRELGAEHVVIYTREDFLATCRQVTGGKGVDVVYDAVGVTTFDKGLEALRPRGMMVQYGQSAGPIPPLDLQRIQPKALYVTRPFGGAYVATREALEHNAGALFRMVAEQALRVHIWQTYPLAQAAQAHAELEGRRTMGKLLLVP